MSIDTSKMSKEKAAALEAAEAGRDEVSQKSFAAGLFVGELNLESVFPFPEQTSEQRKKGYAFLKELTKTLPKLDPVRIDSTGEFKKSELKALANIKAFAIKIPEKYGGLGLSQTYYSKAAMILGGYCGNTTALISAHQSIGVPQPLLLYGTEEQKEKYLPQFAKGSISAFALTEDHVGSDPGGLTTSARKVDGGWELYGEKLWCTNGTKADTIVVMAATRLKKGKRQITAFIVDMAAEGVEVVTRCHFMGLRSLYNGVIRFNHVFVPDENIILAEGKGMRVALNTLNTGRLTLPAACVGLAKHCLKVCREWGSTRKQWGCEIGKHEAIAAKIADMAASTYAMESSVLLAAGLADQKKSEMRVESAMCKMWGTEKAWEIADNTLQIRGGRGYETEESLKNRGEDPIPVERLFRDCRINLIFEGSSEIMRLILAREALDPHLKAAGAVLDSRLPLKTRLIAACKAFWYYAKWYPKQYLPSFIHTSGFNKQYRPILKYINKTSKKLARVLFHSMVRHGPKLDKQQLLLGRLTEIGTELYILGSSVLRANHELGSDITYPDTIIENIYCNTKLKIKKLFFDIKNNNDKSNYKFAREILDSAHIDLEDHEV